MHDFHDGRFGHPDMSPVEKAVLVDTIQKLLIEEAVAADHELQLRRKLLARRHPEFREFRPTPC